MWDKVRAPAIAKDVDSPAGETELSILDFAWNFEAEQAMSESGIAYAAAFDGELCSSSSVT
jgi:hypothetical protein